MAADRQRYSEDLPQATIPGEGKINAPVVQTGRAPIQPYVISNVLPDLSIVLPLQLQLDKRSRHIIILNDGPVIGPGRDLLWTWQQAQSGSRGVLHPGDSITFDEVFLKSDVLWLDVAIGIGDLRYFIYGW